MNIEKIPAARLHRGTIYSMMETSKPVLETFICNQEKITVAFIKGLPVPLYALAYALTRIGVEKRRVYLKSLVGIGIDEKNEINNLIPFWQSIDLPEARRHTNISLFVNLVKDMVDELNCPEEEDTSFDMVIIFAKFVNNIERDYTMSLDNAETV